MGNRIFHVSSWNKLGQLEEGDTFTLEPGPQGAEGKGVYFSEGKPRMTAAEGAAENGYEAIVSAKTPPKKGWWRTKNSIIKKFDRPRTWHSKNKKVKGLVKEVETLKGLPHLKVEISFV